MILEWGVFIRPATEFNRGLHNMYLNAKALVLRETKYKDADKILTVLTADEGKLTVKARGALRKSCKYAAAFRFAGTGNASSPYGE